MPAILRLLIFWIGRRDVISKQEREIQWRSGALTDEQYARTSMMAKRQVKMWKGIRPQHLAAYAAVSPSPYMSIPGALNWPEGPVPKAPPARGFRSRDFNSDWK